MTERKKVSREGIALIKSLEGLRTTAQKAGDGRWVIGYGHTASAREGARLTADEAELLLQYDLLPIVAALNQTVTREVNQHQFDALASYGLSLGAARLRGSPAIQAINEGLMQAAAAAIADDDRTPASAPAAPMAQRRRGAERALFLTDPARAITLSDLLAAPLPFADAASVAAPNAAPVAVDETETPEVAAFPAAETPLIEAPDDAALDSAPEADVATEGGVLRDTRADAVAALLSDTPLTPGVVAEAARTERLVLAQPVEDAVSAPAPTGDSGPEIFQRGVLTLPGAEGPAAGENASSSAGTAAATDIRAGQGNSFARQAEDDVLTGSRPRPGIIRHAPEADTAAPRTRVVETLAFLGLGALGFITFGAALGAFRLAADRAVEGDQTRLIAWTLTLIAAACVGVAAHQLHRRYGSDAVLPGDDA